VEKKQGPLKLTMGTDFHLHPKCECKKIAFSEKCCSFELPIYQIILKKN